MTSDCTSFALLYKGNLVLLYEFCNKCLSLTIYPVISAKNAKSSKTSSTCTRLCRSIKFRAFRCRNFRQQGTCTLTLMRCTTSTHGACFASWESQTYTCTFDRYIYVPCIRYTRMSKYRNPWYSAKDTWSRERNDGLFPLGRRNRKHSRTEWQAGAREEKDREPFDRMTEIRGFDLRE